MYVSNMTSRQRLSDNSVLQLMLGAHLALLVLVAGLHRHWWSGPPFSNVFGNFLLATFGGVFLGQVALVGCWVAFSRSRFVLRCAVLVLFLPLLAAVQAQVYCHGGGLLWWLGHSYDTWLRSTIWVEELSLFGIGVAVLGCGLRCAGWRLEVPTSVSNVSNRNPQFRLIDLLWWFVLLGAILGAGRWLTEFGWTWRQGIVAAEWALDGAWDVRLEFAGLTLFLAAAGLWLKSFRWTLGALILTPLTLPLLDKLWSPPWLYGAGEAIDGGPNRLPQDFMALLYYVFTATFGGTLLVLRDRGYRLTWQNPRNRKPDA